MSCLQFPKMGGEKVKFCQYCSKELSIKNAAFLAAEQIYKKEQEGYRKTILFLEAEISALKMQLEKLSKQRDNCDK